jgi:uncharacterized membrane protein
MKKNIKYKITFSILIILIVVSTILTAIPIEQACGQEQNGCYIVQASEYETTFGIKNANIGLISFTILLIINFLYLQKPKKIKKNLLTLGFFIGSLFAIYFLYLQFFIINATCPYCLITDLGTLTGLGILIFWKEK